MDEIKFLLEKYYRGETTVAEEKRLADLLAVADMAALEPELQADARAFLALDAYAGAEVRHRCTGGTRQASPAFPHDGCRGIGGGFYCGGSRTFL